MRSVPSSISRKAFFDLLLSFRKGSISRRDFMGLTGLGTAMAVLGAASPVLRPGRAFAAEEIGDTVQLATWPNYHDPRNLEAFTALTGATVVPTEFGSNEDMYAALEANPSAFDVFEPSSYAIPTFVEKGLIEPLDLSRVPNYDKDTFDGRFADAGKVNGQAYALSKNWGTTGMAWNSTHASAPFTSWKGFFEAAMGDFSGRVVVQDYELTAIGNALVSLGFDFNSLNPAELSEAEKLLLAVKPHLHSITSDYQPPMRSGEAWLTMCWTGEAKQMNRDMPEILFTIGKEGGEVWADFYALASAAPHKNAAYALVNFLLDPAVNLKEALAHGFPVADGRVNKMLPEEVLRDPILYPPVELLSVQEFGAAMTMTDPNRAEIMRRFKAA